MSRTLYTLFLVLLLPAIALKAQHSNIEFVENKGQWDSRIKFLGKVAAGSFSVEENGFMIVQHKPEEWAKIGEMTHNHEMSQLAKTPFTLHSHAYRVQFLNGNKTAEIIPDKPLPGYNNYFIGNDPSKWGSNCRVYQGITIKDVYPNVDVRYYSNAGAVQYDLIVKPGADISRIALKYDGADKLQIKNKELVIGTSVGNLRELKPFTYQVDTGGRKEVNCKYVLKNNIVTFDVKNYDKTSTLIIDPSLVFCSFLGATADNWGFTATYGPDGSMFGGGIMFDKGTFNPPVTGSFQTKFGGGDDNPNAWGAFDIGIIKLSPNGSNRIYATYIGGSGNEMPQSIICDRQGNLIVAGRTNSLDYPVFPAGNTKGPGGGFDIIVTKLNATGSALIGSARIGGKASDGANMDDYPGGTVSLLRNYGDEARSEVNLDATGNIYLASCTKSDNFPTASPFQPAFGGGKQDGVILKLSPDVSTLLFSSYLGGRGDDAAYVLAINPLNGNVYVAGGTSSTDFPGNHAGVIGPSLNTGGTAIDGFIAEISGTAIVRSTYLGTSGTDQIYGIQFDKKGFPYVTGQTTGAWPVRKAAFVNDGAKQFISKLRPDLSDFVYSTTFGSKSSLPNISPTAFLVDRCENVYVAGWGGCFNCESPEGWGYKNSGTGGMPTTPDALQRTTDGRDFYFFVLQKDAVGQLYGSFFGEVNRVRIDNQNVGNGGDHVDGGTSRFDDNGVIYEAICANCKALDPNAVFPTTPGAWSTSNPSSNGAECNLALVKIAFNLAGVKAGIQSIIDGTPRDSAGCVPLTVDFVDTIHNAKSYEWNFGDGAPTVITTVPGTSHVFNATGTYLVRLIAVDSTTCNIRDTAFVHIRVGDIPANLDFKPVKLSPCDSFKYRFDNLSSSSVPFNNTSFTWDFGDGSPQVIAGTASVFHNYVGPGTYNVNLIITDTTYCNAPDTMTVQLRVAALVKAKFETPPTGCVPYNAEFANTSEAGQEFIWDFGDGSRSTAINPTHLYPVAGTYTITLIANDTSTCNKTDTTRQTITVANPPTANFTFSPVTPIENTPTSFTNQSSPDAVNFVWSFGDGATLQTLTRLPVTHQYNVTGTYNVCLVAINGAGCPDTTCQQINAVVTDAVDVPNAFTPLSSDINNTVFVRGFGITKLQFIIWNRWGQKVFETNDVNIGWDGKLKGVVQPMDVYAYTLSVEFSDGKKATKKGDITLIR